MKDHAFYPEKRTSTFLHLKPNLLREVKDRQMGLATAVPPKRKARLHS